MDQSLDQIRVWVVIPITFIPLWHYWASFIRPITTVAQRFTAGWNKWLLSSPSSLHGTSHIMKASQQGWIPDEYQLDFFMILFFSWFLQVCVVSSNRISLSNSREQPSTIACTAVLLGGRSGYEIPLANNFKRSNPFLVLGVLFDSIFCPVGVLSLIL